MNATELIGIINEGESSYVEFKHDDGQENLLAKEMSALFNLAGWLILLGIEDDVSVSGLVRSRNEVGHEHRPAEPSAGFYSTLLFLLNEWNLAFGLATVGNRKVCPPWHIFRQPFTHMFLSRLGVFQSATTCRVQE